MLGSSGQVLAQVGTDAAGQRGKILYSPPEEVQSPGAMYPRVVRLEHSGPARVGGTLLATFEYYKSFDEEDGLAYFPVFLSTNGGQTWTRFSRIEDQIHGWGLRYQPTLFELPRQMGPWPAGTVMAAGNAIPKDLSKTSIDVYASTDGGSSWSYVSTVVEGGRAEPGYDIGSDNNPVWEPEFATNAAGDLVCYYSDERYKEQGYNQLLAHRTSTDGGLSWGPEVFDVAVPDETQRPGMATVVRLPGERYLMSFEVVGPTYDGGVRVKGSPDGEDWGDPADLGSAVRTDDGRQFTNGPYITWTPIGGPAGTVVASAKTLRESNGIDEAPGSGAVLLVNKNSGRGTWTAIDAPLRFETEVETGQIFAGWTTPLLPSPNGRRILEMTSAPVDSSTCAIKYATRPLQV